MIQFLNTLKTIKNEGVLVLYKSLIPSYLRLGPWNIIVIFLKLKS